MQQSSTLARKIADKRQPECQLCSYRGQKGQQLRAQQDVQCASLTVLFGAHTLLALLAELLVLCFAP